MDVYQEAVCYLESERVAGDAPPESVLEEDVFEEEEEAVLCSPLLSESIDLPDTPTICSPAEMADRRLLVLRGIVESEEVYLRELETLLMPMKALWASAGTSQPVLTGQQVQTVFYQVPELRDLHREFHSGLKARLSAYCRPADPGQVQPGDWDHTGSDLTVGDLFLKMVNQIGLYCGFIENYQGAVEVVRKCTRSEPLFRTLAENMMTNRDADNARTAYTLEALLYKPLDRVTRTTLVLRDLLNTTPAEHGDYSALQEALRLSRSFLSGVNENSRCKREVTLSHGARRKLVRDGFVVDVSEGERSLRHLFLYTDLLLCTRVKRATKGKADQYRFCWYLPLSGLRLHWAADRDPSSDARLRLRAWRTKVFLQRQQQRAKGTRGASLTARSRKKMEQMELALHTHSPCYRLELHSPSGKSHTLLLSSLYELEEWREAIHNLTSHNIQTVPPDLLTLTGACVKLRMTQQPPLQIYNAAEDTESLCGTLRVAVHSALGFLQPACVYICVEVDGHEFYDKQAQTHCAVRGVNPHWDQELCFQVDGARSLRLLCVAQSDGRDHDVVLGKTTFGLECESLNKRWRRRTVQLGQVEVSLSLKYSPHPLDPPGSTVPQQPVFGVPIESVARLEGVLVPLVVRCCAEEVERRGLGEVGIYRISGTASEVLALKAAFNSNQRDAVTGLRSAEVNVVSGVLKLYFRELPEPLVPTELFHSLAAALDVQDTNSQLESLLSLLESCPEANRHTFLYLMHHLQRVSEKQEVNKMSPMNLATVFGPSLLRLPESGQGHKDLSREMVAQVQVVFHYLQCNNLPEAQIFVEHDTDAEDGETTHV